jgi:hypothetical protein
MADLRFPLGDRLASLGIELADWTVQDEGPLATHRLLSSLFAAGTATVITDAPRAVAACATALSAAG